MNEVTAQKLILPDFFLVPTVLVEDEDIQPLDYLVFAVVYWYSKLKLEKCTASNKHIANVLSLKKKKHINPASISNSLQKLNKKKYVRIILDSNNQRLEIIPLIAFSATNEPTLGDVPPTSNDVPPYIKTPTSNDVQNKKSIEQEEINNITDVVKSTKRIHGVEGEEKKLSRWSGCPVVKNSFDLKDRYPGGHDECDQYLRDIENFRKRGFANRNQQLFWLHDLLAAGFDFTEIDRLIELVEKKYGPNNWDFERIIKWADKEDPSSLKPKRPKVTWDEDGHFEEQEEAAHARST